MLAFIRHLSGLAWQLFGWTKVRFFITGRASQESPIAVKEWTIFRDIWVRSVPGLYEDFYLYGTSSSFHVERVEHRLMRPHWSLRVIFVRLTGTVTPHDSDHLIKQYGWVRDDVR